jgi:hypothetical protein
MIRKPRKYCQYASRDHCGKRITECIRKARAGHMMCAQHYSAGGYWRVHDRRLLKRAD